MHRHDNSLNILAQREATKYRPPDRPARIPLLRLDWIWFYIPGTLCNLGCGHCLVSGGPNSRILIPMEVKELEQALEEVAEYQNGRPFQIGFTGGEVFILKSKKFHRRLFPMVEKALEYGDLLVLTNGILADHDTLKALMDIEHQSSNSITYRISLDGPTSEENDGIRYHLGGRPTFALIIQSLHRFLYHGIHPVIAYTYEGTGKATEVSHRKEVLERRYKVMLKNFGLVSLELWGIPFFDQGQETHRRTISDLPHIESLGITNHCIASYTNHGFDRFQCSYSRSFGKEATGEGGWYKCAVLAAKEVADGAYLGSSLKKALKEITLDHPQCMTCFQAATQGIGMSCSGN
ncbi:radical SAM protein [candidate division KSB1 bacterium]|nr:radical SAM protein [candidate division KSB1 bacterium]